MKKHLLLALSMIIFTVLYAQNSLAYTLNHRAGTGTITVEMAFDSIRASGLKLVIPRSAPGTYEITNYLAFVDDVEGFTTSGEVLTGAVGDGSFFQFTD